MTTVVGELMILTKIPIFAPKPTVLEVLSKGCNHAVVH